MPSVMKIQIKTRWLHSFGGYCVYFIILGQGYMGVTDLLVMLNMSETYSFLPYLFVIFPIVIYGIAVAYFEYNQHFAVTKHRASAKPVVQSNSLHSLPTYTWEELSVRISQGNKWIVVSGIICMFHYFLLDFFVQIDDISKYMDLHPGGRKILASALGIDCSKYFNNSQRDGTITIKRKNRRK